VKKGRHRRFEEARKLKQQGPGAFLPDTRNGRSHDDDDAAGGDDEFSDLAAKYGAFDDEDDEAADDD
jgi:hypothetical protein